MQSRSRLIPGVVAALWLSLMLGCGSSSPKAVPPPSGGFSNSNLKGTYVFSAIGADSLGNFQAMAGTLTADGNGAITGGTFDLSNPNGAGVFTGLTVSSGSVYRVTVDGRGIVTLRTTQGVFGFDFVLTSSQHGLLTSYDTGGTGSGSLDLQATISQSQLAGSYALSLTGVDGNINPLATVAGFTLDGSGTISNGIQDVNDSQTALSSLSLTGTVLVGAAGGPGTAQLVTQTSLGTLKFDVFAIDATHLKFIETDASPFLVGDAFPQQTAFPVGTNILTVSGLDFTVTVPAPFVAGGFMVTDGSGNVTSASSEDINDVGNVTTGIAFTGSYSALTDGRSTLTLTGFNNAQLSSTTTFAAYPTAGGLLLLEIDGTGITSGTASLQSNTTLAASQGYGLNLTASNLNQGAGTFFEEDDIAQFTNTSGAFSGIVDYNDMGSLKGNQVFTATYAADSGSSGRGTMTSNSSFNLITYVVDSSTTAFIEQDNSQIGVGAFQLQNASAKSNLAASHLAVLRLKPGTKGAVRRR